MEKQTTRTHQLCVTLNSLSGQVVDAAYKIRTTLGPGLLESVYESALARELSKRQIPFQRQYPIQVLYDGVLIQTAIKNGITRITNTPMPPALSA